MKATPGLIQWIVFFKLSNSFVSAQDFTYSSGRHVCEQEVEEKKLMPVHSEVCIPVLQMFKRKCIDSNGKYLDIYCSGYRTIYKLVRRTTYQMMPSKRLRYTCCPGWKRQPGKLGCTKPVCDSGCFNDATCIGPGKCKCKNGYKGPTCNEDINECEFENGGCTQKCKNTNGSYSCSCGDGFQLSNDMKGCEAVCKSECLNGGKCVGPDECKCTEGFKGPTCKEDINECELQNGGCAQKCENTNGSYSCSCDNGFQLSNDRKSCEGVCYSGCFNDGICVGPDECKCTEGYKGPTCKEDINECEFENGGCAQKCENTDGSYRCSCGGGFRLSNDMKSCEVCLSCSKEWEDVQLRILAMEKAILILAVKLGAYEIEEPKIIPTEVENERNSMIEETTKILENTNAITKETEQIEKETNKSGGSLTKEEKRKENSG